jgi:hypothetical protein
MKIFLSNNIDKKILKTTHMPEEMNPFESLNAINCIFSHKKGV